MASVSVSVSVSVETRPVARECLQGRLDSTADRAAREFLGSTADAAAGWAWVSSGAAAAADWGEEVGELIRRGRRAAALRVWKEAWDASGVGAGAAAD
jgi:hypothetical protein